MNTQRKYSSEESREIGATILAQLGGGKFIAMTGAKELGFGDGTLEFRIGRNSSKANKVMIRLEDNDTYTIVFFSFRKMELKEVKKFEGVYDDNLQSIFTDFTGLYTSL